MLSEQQSDLIGLAFGIIGIVVIFPFVARKLKKTLALKNALFTGLGFTKIPLEKYPELKSLFSDANGVSKTYGKITFGDDLYIRKEEESTIYLYEMNYWYNAYSDAPSVYNFCIACLFPRAKAEKFIVHSSDREKAPTDLFNSLARNKLDEWFLFNPQGVVTHAGVIYRHPTWNENTLEITLIKVKNFCSEIDALAKPF